MTEDQNTTMYVTISDLSALGSLADHLKFAAPDADIRVVPGVLEAGQLGAEDLLMVVASSPVLIAALKTLPDFLRARGSRLSVELTFKNKSITMTAGSLDEIMPVLDKFLNE